MKYFDISSASTEEIYSKLDIKSVLYDSLKDLDFDKYTALFKSLYVVFQCFPSDIKSRKVETFKKMRRSTKTLELYLVLDYDTIMQGTDEENLTHMKEVFLQGCEIFLKEMKAFDWEGFKAQVGEGLNI